MGISRRSLLQGAAGGSLLLAGRSIAADASIDEAGFVRIGGIDQWIAVQGRNIRNPIILFLHGGPGEAQSPILNQFAQWTNDFTLVNWDQRGSGKTFGRNGPSTPDMTIDRMIDDAIEIAESMRRRFSQRKVFLVGHSWGSILGVHVIRRQPDLFHAFVGTGQLVSFAATLAHRVEWARQQATKANDQSALKALDDAAMLPEERGRRSLALANITNKWVLPPSDDEYAKILRDFAGTASENRDAADWNAGAAFSGPRLNRFVLTVDFPRTAPDLPTPFFVVQGRDDHISSFEPAKAYVEQVRAPAKAFVPIEGGHFACFTNPDQFVGALRKYVRPLA